MSGDLTQVQALSKRLLSVASDAERELQRVTSTAARIAKTETARAIAGTYNISARRAVQSLVARSGSLQVEVRGTGRPISAASFAGRQVKAGYRFQVVRGSSALTVSRGFQPKRGGAPLRREGPPRLPVRGIYGPSIPTMMAIQQVYDSAEKVIGGRISADVQRRIDRAIG